MMVRYYLLGCEVMYRKFAGVYCLTLQSRQISPASKQTSSKLCCVATCFFAGHTPGPWRWIYYIRSKCQTTGCQAPEDSMLHNLNSHCCENPQISQCAVTFRNRPLWSYCQLEVMYLVLHEETEMHNVLITYSETLFPLYRMKLSKFI